MDLFGDIDDISSESDEDKQTPVPRQPVGGCGVPQNQHMGQRISETRINQHVGQRISETRINQHMGQRISETRINQHMGQRISETRINQYAGQHVSDTRIKIEIPTINSDLGNELYFVKLPKFLRIEPKPFDPQLYEDEFEDEKVLYEEDKTKLKLKVENTIRWRTRRHEEGYKIKESNARVVKWSDGSMSLHLGKEVFDVYKAPLPDNHNQLFIREDTGLRGQAIFKSRLTFRPHCTDSATYKKMTLSFGNISSKTQIRILPMAGCDPEWTRTDLLKKKECLRVSTRQTLQRKNKPSSSSTIQEPNTDGDEEEKEGEEEEGGEEKESKASSLGITNNHNQGAVHRDEPSRKRTRDEAAD